ncbi:MAG: sigma-54 dependent transcriptional regulator [Verrucomicrobia bacterium]|nr:sigma-54 dependent transcriptional regulator [Verrucomicrobiota bacterium]MDA1087745.1 sigma-54 dependent transcriptional regulator [Verrucomicrobiota bacterium]
MSTKQIILIVDDDRNTRDGLGRALRSQYDVKLAESAETALSVLSSAHVDVLLTDLRMPGMDGLTLLSRAMSMSDPPICVLLTAYGNVETAVEAMKHGAYDYLTKPVNLDRLEILLQRALRTREIESENLLLHERLNEKYGIENIVSHAEAMREAFETIKQAAPTQATVLVQGESGTGKELVAQALHHLSPRSKGPFVAVHCAALSANVLESELFGHEKGAFTGAVERHRGRFEIADGGTLFLDEISEIAPEMQVKLLRVLETRAFERVGGNQSISVDIRLIAATNAELWERVESGSFREDLYFRLNVVDISLPPLREREGDVPLLCKLFLQEFSQANGKDISDISADALQLLSAYAWPGNVRELRNVIEKMVILTRGNRLTVRDVPAAVRDGIARGATRRPGRTATRAAVSAARLDDAEREMIEEALEENKGNKTKAAQQLGISRRTLHRKLNRYTEDEDQ